MDRMMKTRIGSLAAFLAFFAAGSAMPAMAAMPAMSAEETGWRLRLTGVSAQSTGGGGGGGFNSSLGTGLGLEYRATPRVGVELAVLSTSIDDELGIDFFGVAHVSIRSSLRVTPVLAQLDLHLTPGHRVDLVLAPVVGFVRYGDLETRVSGPEGSGIGERVPTKDGFAWGAHLGLDVPLGGRGLLVTAGATYLKARIEPRTASAESGAPKLDLDPLFLQAGIGYRF
jgi:opacity protein-like surface antigen